MRQKPRQRNTAALIRAMEDPVFEVYYCQPSRELNYPWASGVVRLGTHEALAEWVRDQMSAGPLLVTKIVVLGR